MNLIFAWTFERDTQVCMSVSVSLSGSVRVRIGARVRVRERTRAKRIIGCVALLFSAFQVSPWMLRYGILSTLSVSATTLRVELSPSLSVYAGESRVGRDCLVAVAAVGCLTASSQRATLLTTDRPRKCLTTTRPLTGGESRHLSFTIEREGESE